METQEQTKQRIGTVIGRLHSLRLFVAKMRDPALHNLESLLSVAESEVEKHLAKLMDAPDKHS
jgi:hypothetical protein